MSQHNKHTITRVNPFTITDPTELKRLLKAIYHDGATGTSRSLSEDVQTITDLLHQTNQEAPGGTTQQTNS